MAFRATCCGRILSLMSRLAGPHQRDASDRRAGQRQRREQRLTFAVPERVAAPDAVRHRDRAQRVLHACASAPIDDGARGARADRAARSTASRWSEVDLPPAVAATTLRRDDRVSAGETRLSESPSDAPRGTRSPVPPSTGRTSPSSPSLRFTRRPAAELRQRAAGPGRQPHG